MRFAFIVILTLLFSSELVCSEKETTQASQDECKICYQGFQFTPYKNNEEMPLRSYFDCEHTNIMCPDCIDLHCLKNVQKLCPFCREEGHFIIQKEQNSTPIVPYIFLAPLTVQKELSEDDNPVPLCSIFTKGFAIRWNPFLALTYDEEEMPVIMKNCSVGSKDTSIKHCPALLFNRWVATAKTNPALIQKFSTSVPHDQTTKDLLHILTHPTTNLPALVQSAKKIKEEALCISEHKDLIEKVMQEKQEYVLKQNFIIIGHFLANKEAELDAWRKQKKEDLAQKRADIFFQEQAKALELYQQEKVNQQVSSEGNASLLFAVTRQSFENLKRKNELLEAARKKALEKIQEAENNYPSEETFKEQYNQTLGSRIQDATNEMLKKPFYYTVTETSLPTEDTVLGYKALQDIFDYYEAKNKLSLALSVPNQKKEILDLTQPKEPLIRTFKELLPN